MLLLVVHCDDLGFLVAEANVVGGHAGACGGLGQSSLLFAFTQFQVEKFAVLLNVVEPFWFQLTAEVGIVESTPIIF